MAWAGLLLLDECGRLLPTISQEFTRHGTPWADHKARPPLLFSLKSLARQGLLFLLQFVHYLISYIARLII